VNRKEVRHKAVGKHAPGVYYSERVGGKKTYEVRHPETRRWETVGPRLDAAKARVAELTVATYRGGVVADPTMTVADLIVGWQEARDVAPRTAETQDAHVRLYVLPRWGRVKVRDVGKVGIASWLRDVKGVSGSELSEGSKAGLLATLRSIMEHAVDTDVVGVNPCKQIARGKKPRQSKPEERILRPGELEQVLAACDRFPWLRDIIMGTLYGALRLGEVCGLKWGDVDFEAGTITVARSRSKDGKRFGPTKGKNVVALPLVPEFAKMLRPLYLAARDKSPDAPVFPNGIGGHRQPRDVQRAWGKARRYAGLSTEPRALTFHDLRHTAISRLANQPGAIMPHVQAFARHANFDTTQGYIHPVGESTDWIEQASVALSFA